MWFDTWSDLGRILAVGPLAYVALLLVLRVSGARTLSKLNAFDLVVTVALGSTLATIVLDSAVTLAEGVTALVMLVGLQFLVSHSTAVSDRFRRLVTSQPVLLYRHGFLPPAMRRARVTEDEVAQVVRAAGHPSLRDVAAVVLETDGTLSVLPAVPDLPSRRP